MRVIVALLQHQRHQMVPGTCTFTFQARGINQRFSRRLSSNQETLQWRRHALIFVMFFVNSDSMLSTVMIMEGASLKAQTRKLSVIFFASFILIEDIAHGIIVKIRSSSVLQPRVSSIVSLFHVVYQQNIFWLFSFPWRCIFVSEEDWAMDGAMDEAMDMISDSQYQSPHDLMAP
ncbi:hypothetical protein OIU74_025115 [Salix koriyanagi]|uniref:Uncharacterized protein n=1 Tax=Salix koriyanagi TaxID=2511006 RepID=A0A9Q0W0Z7_9ROSI|nr:hypothetical protein OIU74_025115 [Salix koriyanagi]